MPEKKIIYIKSEHLQLAEPLMIKYFDFNSTMFDDEMQNCIYQNNVNCMYKEEGSPFPVINTYRGFCNNKELVAFGVTDNIDMKSLISKFSKYFGLQDNDDEEESISEDDIVLLCLTFIAYAYYKQKEGLYKHAQINEILDTDYEYTLHNSIYPEILSLYRLILESKKRKNRGEKLTITYKQDKININASAWFLDDMEKYFKDRFPRLTLEDMNNMLPPKRKGGKPFKDRTTTNIVWGTYQLLKNHHSQFKDSKTQINKEICQFILDYLDYLGIEHDYVDTDIKDNLKDMIKRDYIPKWNLPWKFDLLNIEEKENIVRRYDIYS